MGRTAVHDTNDSLQCQNNKHGSMVLQRFCQCRGSLAYVHPGCLERWRRMQRQDICELCQSPYSVSDEPELELDINRNIRNTIQERSRGSMPLGWACMCVVAILISLWLPDESSLIVWLWVSLAGLAVGV